MNSSNCLETKCPDCPRFLCENPLCDVHFFRCDVCYSKIHIGSFTEIKACSKCPSKTIVFLCCRHQKWEAQDLIPKIERIKPSLHECCSCFSLLCPNCIRETVECDKCGKFTCFACFEGKNLSECPSCYSQFR